MVWKPDVTVAAVVERDGRFLMVEERIKGRRVFNQPAGHVEDGESLLEAVARETLEETAWQFIPEWFLGVYLWRHPLTGRSTLRFAFTGFVDRHFPERLLDPPVMAAHWLTRAQLLERSELLRTPLVLRCIDDYLAGQRASLRTVPAMPTR